MDSSILPPQRREALRASLLAAVDLLHRRCANAIPIADIEAYVELDWMEWQGGGLKVTTTGENICRQLTVRPR
jgi:hypothetical protein